MTFPTELKKITVRSIPTEKSRARERTYDAQILVLGDFVDFYITSATKRDIQNRDHLNWRISVLLPAMVVPSL